MLQELNENAAGLFDSGEDSDVVEGMSIMNDLVIPCMHLMISNDICQEDLDAIEIMRDRWCSYLGTDMDGECRSPTHQLGCCYRSAGLPSGW